MMGEMSDVELVLLFLVDFCIIIEDNYFGRFIEEDFVIFCCVFGNILGIVYLICVVEFCERVFYYGV